MWRVVSLRGAGWAVIYVGWRFPGIRDSPSRLRCECVIAACVTIRSSCLCSTPKVRGEKRRRDKSEAAEGRKQRVDTRKRAAFTAQVNEAVVEAAPPPLRPGRQREQQSLMCATAEENRAANCLLHTNNLMPCPGPDASGTKSCVSEGEAMFICAMCKKNWRCMCHLCNTHAQTLLREFVFVSSNCLLI